MPAKQTAKKPDLKRIGLSEDVLMGLYFNMLKTRTVDERLRKLFRQGRYAGTYFSAVGQEATTVGPTYGLGKEDIIAPSHREIGAAITKGISIEKIIAQIYARSNSPDKGKSHPCHYGDKSLGVIHPSSTVASQSIIGTGCALGFKIQKKDNVVVGFFGEGGTSRGGWHEALNFAGIHNLPVVYICQNNLWAESVPSTMQANIEKFSDRAKAYGFPGITIDGNDVVLVHKTASEAIARARAGDGPTLIECLTYRWYGHSEIDPADYRSNEELEEWKTKDPLARAEKLLMDLDILSTQKREAIVAEINQELDDAIKISEEAKYCEPEEAYNDVYSEAFPVVRDEY